MCVVTCDFCQSIIHAFVGPLRFALLCIIFSCLLYYIVHFCSIWLFFRVVVFCLIFQLLRLFCSNARQLQSCYILVFLCIWLNSKLNYVIHLLRQLVMFALLFIYVHYCWQSVLMGSLSFVRLNVRLGCTLMIFIQVGVGIFVY